MNYLDYIIIFSIFFYAIISSINFYRKITFDHFYKMVSKAILEKQQSINGESFFSSLTLKKIVKFLLKEHNKSAKRALLYLCFGKIEAAVRYLDKHQQKLLEILLKSHYTLQELEDVSSEIDLANFYFIKGNIAKLRIILENIDIKNTDKYTRAKYFYYQSFCDMESGDMLSASENCSKSINLFNKEKAYIEEIKAYILIGTIYRISCVEDVAQFMFDSALKISQKLKYQVGCAEAYGNFGMLMIMQERFEEAEAYFAKALEINIKINRLSAICDIYNQMALTYLLQKKYKSAIEQIKLALKNVKNSAFSLDILSLIYYEMKDYRQALEKAEKAKKLYKGINLSAMLESMYLQSLIYFEQNILPESETILRRIITIAKKKSGSFHIANAYNLLGLIFLQLKDFKRAKGLFQQALSFEQKNERLTGVATDYANIGLIEWRMGNCEAARKTLQTALEYAKAYGENDLSKILEKRIKKLDV